MLVACSTIKDAVAGVESYLARNLAGGADHVVVFLDDPEGEGQEDVAAMLEAHPHATAVRTDAAWWGEERPDDLNTRQRVNVNLLVAALTALGTADWVFHVDGDEALVVDPGTLDGLGPDVVAVRAQPLEAVSRSHWEQPPTAFKRLLGKQELTLLHVLGVIDEPTNGHYFHGHVDGKPGIRPRLDHALALHHVVGPDGSRVESHTDPGVRVLHYESFSAEEFVRKWTAIFHSGPPVNVRPVREPTALAVQALLRRGMTPAEADPWLRRIFERTTEDDYETLRDLGLLVELDPLAGGHRPEGLSRADDLVALLAALGEGPKRCFHPREPVAEAESALASALQRAAVGERGRTRRRRRWSRSRRTGGGR